MLVLFEKERLRTRILFAVANLRVDVYQECGLRANEPPPARQLTRSPC